MDGFGKISWWGFTPAQDLQSLTGLSKENSDLLDILVIGAGDARHVLKTIAQSYRHDKKCLQFCVLENNLEPYARQLLLLTIAFESQQRIGLQEKTELFLEIFGNSLVREQSERYVELMATEFIRWVTDADYLSKVMPLFDLSNLKFKERDLLEAIFKFWRITDPKVFNIMHCWDLRLRQYLGTRYDAIPNVFDWDYSMKLCEKSASVIHTRHYTRWRHKGMAYEIREGTYDTPNKTLASGAVFSKDGERVARCGYWGDIIVSPYIAFGIESENEALFQQSNKVHMKTAQDVAEFNVLAMFHELAHQTPYVPVEKPKPKSDSIQLTEITEELNEIENNTTESQAAVTESKSPLEQQYTPIPVDTTRVTFLPLNSSQELSKKSKFQQKFKIVYIANSMIHLLTKELMETCANGAIVVVETSKYLLELTDSQHEEFNKKINEIANAAGCQTIEAATVDSCFAKFKYSAPQ